MIVICVDTKGTRLGNFTIGKKYAILEDWNGFLPEAYVTGDLGVEYDWSVVKDLFVPLDKWRDNQINKVLE